MVGLALRLDISFASQAKRGRRAASRPPRKSQEIYVLVKQSRISQVGRVKEEGIPGGASARYL